MRKMMGKYMPQITSGVCFGKVFEVLILKQSGLALVVYFSNFIRCY